MSYLLGLDIGTSGTKGILIAEDGRVVGIETSSYPLSTPEAGWAEQDPEDWWQATKQVISDVINESGINAADLAAISFSGQMHSSVFLDKDMQVIRPAILWNDTRTSRQCQEIYDRVEGLNNLIKYVSNPALEGFTAPKILWLRENEPENFQKVNKVLLPKDYIRYRLTGEVNMEVSDAAGTLLLDVKAKEWSREMLEKLELDPDLLPPVIDSIAVAGRVGKKIAQKIGIKPGTPIIGGGADNACGAVGSGIVKKGRVMFSIGTSGVVLAQTESPTADPEGRVHLFNHAQPDSWYMMGVMLSAGGSFTWMKEDLFADKLDYEKLNTLAADVSVGSEGLIFLPYLQGERTPHADADARGVFFGISRKHEQKHFVRSVMEGVTFGLRDSLELIREAGVEIEEIRAIGGGARSEVWQQILADISGEPVNLLNIEEGPAFGAALIAGVGAGIYDSFAEAEAEIIEITKTIEPIQENVDRYQRYYPLYRQLYRSLKEDYKQLSQLT